MIELFFRLAKYLQCRHHGRGVPPYCKKTGEFLAAAEQGDVQRVKHFVEVEKIDIDATVFLRPESTALVYAVENSQIEVVKLLLKNRKIERGKVVARPSYRDRVRRKNRVAQYI
eukprot:511183_1